MLGIVLWWTYTGLLAYTGILQDYSLPPKFPLLLILPAFLFTGIVLYRNRQSPVLHAIPASWPIYFQSFRVGVESLFVASFAAGLLHKEVTIEGYNYDMLVGLSAPLIGLLVFQFRVLPKRIALLWNYLGILVLIAVVAVFMTTIFFPELWGSETPLAPKAFGTFPFVLVASFLMPVAIFVHILSIIQLSRSERTVRDQTGMK
jgi:uncharacterized membrane protein